MNPETFDIQEFNSPEKAKQAGYTVPLTDEQAGELSGMNRAQRRLWLRSKRKSGKKKN